MADGSGSIAVQDPESEDEVPDLNRVHNLRVEECRATLQAGSLILAGAVNAGQLLRVETLYLVEDLEFKGKSGMRNHKCTPQDITLIEVLDPPQEALF